MTSSVKKQDISTLSSKSSISQKDSDSSDENDVSNDTVEEYSTKEPSENDVLCGRGGSINSHPGNERFRILVEKRKRVYLTARFKREKRLIASSIVTEIRALNPPGRFLSRDGKSGLWVDIGDEKARDKTSQALRENAPSIRAEIETEVSKQRADIQSREDDRVKNAPTMPAIMHSLYAPSWVYPYYTYGHILPPPMPHGHLHPPPMPSYGHAPPMPPGPALSHYNPYYTSYGTTPDPYLHPPPTQKIPHEQTTSVGSLRVDSFKLSSKSRSINDVGGASISVSNDGVRSMGAKPIPYKHGDGDQFKKRRMVKFRDDDSSQNTQRLRRVRPCYSPVNASDSLVDNLEDENDMEPQRLDAVDHNQSLISQVAHYLSPTVGSWDLANIVCGHDTCDEIPFPHSSTSKAVGADECYYEDDEAIDWEGQEVQLVDIDRKAQPPERRNPPVPQQKNDNSSSVAYSSLGSCHSWLPENFGSAASYFSYGKGDDQSGGCGSLLDMDSSAGGLGEFSAAGSLGGNSLNRVFENEAFEEGLPITSPNMNARVLSRVPSWERSLRSKSPLSVGSDDESLMSKSSIKFEDEPLSPINFQSGIASIMGSIDEEDLSWTKE